MPARLFVGVDGGGTRCRARIEDGDGRTLGAGAAGAAAVRLGVDRAMAEIEAACLAAVADARLPATALAQMDAGVALAGIGRKGVLAEVYARPHPFRTVAYLNDANAACLGAHGGNDGGIVVVGTGSAGLALVQGREMRIGGYGFPISDEGSGADLGLRAIRFSLRAFDGRIAHTRLTRDVMARFDDDPFTAVAWMDTATATEYATLAPLVMRHADTGDAVGRCIVRAAARQVDAMVRRLIEYGAPRVALAGGVASRIEPWLSPDVQRRLAPAEGDAVAGALLVAKRQTPAAVRRTG